MNIAEQLFYDPFAEAGEELFDAATAFDQIVDRYEAGKVEHDYSADNFLADTRALLLDAQFVEQFDQMAYIASQMHALCQHDADLYSLATESGIFGRDDDHEHDSHARHEHSDDETASKKSKKKSKKHVGAKEATASKSQIRHGWFEFLWQNMNKEVKKT